MQGKPLLIMVHGVSPLSFPPQSHLIESKAFDTPTVYEVRKRVQCAYVRIDVSLFVWIYALNFAQILSTQFLPLVEEHAAREREGLQRMERALDLVLAAQKTHFQTLFQCAQTAAHLWESHCTSLAEKQRAFQVTNQTPSLPLSLSRSLSRSFLGTFPVINPPPLSLSVPRKVMRSVARRTTQTTRTWRPTLTWSSIGSDRAPVHRL